MQHAAREINRATLERCMTDYPLPYNSIDLAGRVALVTGASSGLGLRFAQVLAAQGASVALCARRVDRLEATAAQIRRAGGKALAVEMDATDAASLTSAVDAAESEFGTVVPTPSARTR